MIFTGIFGITDTTELEFKFYGISAILDTAADAVQLIIRDLIPAEIDAFNDLTVAFNTYLAIGRPEGQALM